jgi:catechol 2,3-dioxygenase
MIRPNKVGHVVLKVNDFTQAEKFYTGVLGFDIVNRLDRPRAVFLTLGVQHHDIALFEVNAEADVPKANRVGLHHLALQFNDVAALKEAYEILKQKGVEVVRAVDHVTTNSIYFQDPAGNRLELYCDIGENGLERARDRTVRSIEDFPPLNFG